MQHNQVTPQQLCWDGLPEGSRGRQGICKQSRGTLAPGPTGPGQPLGESWGLLGASPKERGESKEEAGRLLPEKGHMQPHTGCPQGPSGAFQKENMFSRFQGAPLKTPLGTSARPLAKHPIAGQLYAPGFTQHTVKFRGLMPQPEDFNLNVNKKPRMEGG